MSATDCQVCHRGNCICEAEAWAPTDIGKMPPAPHPQLRTIAALTAENAALDAMLALTRASRDVALAENDRLQRLVEAYRALAENDRLQRLVEAYRELLKVTGAPFPGTQAEKDEAAARAKVAELEGE